MLIDERYIVAVEETDADYDRILSILSDKPVAPDGFHYRLTTDLTWELCENVAAPDAD